MDLLLDLLPRARLELLDRDRSATKQPKTTKRLEKNEETPGCSWPEGYKSKKDRLPERDEVPYPKLANSGDPVGENHRTLHPQVGLFCPLPHGGCQS